MTPAPAGMRAWYALDDGAPWSVPVVGFIATEDPAGQPRLLAAIATGAGGLEVVDPDERVDGVAALVGIYEAGDEPDEHDVDQARDWLFRSHRRRLAVAR